MKRIERKRLKHFGKRGLCLVMKRLCLCRVNSDNSAVVVVVVVVKQLQAPQITSSII